MTRTAMEREANDSGQSISQVAERLLILGLDAKRRRARNKALKAVCFLIEQLALNLGAGAWLNYNSKTLPSHVDKSLQDDWRNDPFRYAAFCIAVQQLLNALRPKGEVRSPYTAEEIDKLAADSGAIPQFLIDEMKLRFVSPETLGTSVFGKMWDHLCQENVSEIEDEVMQRIAGTGQEWIREALRTVSYGMRDARHDLGFVKKGHPA